MSNTTTRTPFNRKSMEDSYPTNPTQNNQYTSININKKNNGDNVITSKEMPHTNEVNIFCFNLGYLPNWIIFTILLCIIFFGFIINGWVEEGIKFRFEKFNFGWFMTSFELTLFSFFAMFERYFKYKATNVLANISMSNINIGSMSIANMTLSSINNKDMSSNKNKTKNKDEVKSLLNSETNSFNSNNISTKNDAIIEKSMINIMFERQMQLKFHFIVAFAMTISRGLTNIALLLLNYPTQVVFKSMKLLTVMFGSVVVLRKEYNIYEYIAAPVLVVSAILFTLGDNEDSLTFNLLGIFIVLISIIFDGIHANCQEYILKARHKDTALELLVYSNFIAGILAGIISLISGEYPGIMEFIKRYDPRILLLWFSIRVACLYIGVSAFIAFTKKFGAVYAVTITTVRKILTVLLSYVFYPTQKPFTDQHLYGTLTFAVAMMLNGFGAKQRKTRTK